MLQGKGLDVPLELSLKDLHVQVVLVDLLLTGALGLGLVALVVHQHAELLLEAHVKPSRSDQS
jgi:hypothetical protein